MRVAVFGVSHWHSAMHLPALKLAGAKIVAVSDPDSAVGHRAAGEHDARFYPDVETLLEAAQPELVLAMGKPAEVLELARRLIEARVPSIIEKPIGLSAREAEPLAEEARRHGVFVTVPLVNRYSELWRKLDELAAGEPGLRRLHAHFRVVNGFPFRYRRMGVDWMLDPRISGGGALRNLGIHAVHAFLQFAAGEEVRVESAALHQWAEEPIVEDFAAATLVTPSGVIGTIEAGYSLAAGAGSDTEWRVATSEAYMVDRNQTLRIAEIGKGMDEVVPIPSVRDRYDQFAADTIARVRSGQPPLITLDDYVHATRLLDEIYERGRAPVGADG